MVNGLKDSSDIVFSRYPCSNLAPWRIASKMSENALGFKLTFICVLMAPQAIGADLK